MTGQYNLPLPQNEAMTADDFMVTDSNREAVGWILEREPSSWPSHCFVLYGLEGCGKTHLLTIWREKHGAHCLQRGEAILDKVVAGDGAFKALVLDDAEKIAGDEAQEEWLQHLYNASQAAKIPLLLGASCPPAAWGVKLRDIESRLKSSAAVEVREPDDALMRGLLLKQFADRQLLVEDGVIEYLAQRLERTGTAVRRAVQALDQKALEKKRKITVPFAQEVLGR